MHPKTHIKILAGRAGHAALGCLLPGLLVLLLLSLLPPARAQTPPPAGTCARVEIQLSQSVAITRTAFRATLTIGNSPVNSPLQNLKVTLDIRDGASNPANAAFGISDPVLTGIGDVVGGGTITPGTQATAVWTILPTRDAAPLANTKYTVGGTITYTLDGVNVTLPLFPAPITVKPDPLLQFHYFLQRDVYGDDPFTPEVEASEPFSLGLLAVNTGAGEAHNMTITSSQPKIVDNAKGLQIAFQLLGASINGQPVSPSLTAALGDIPPGKTAVADFLLLSTLQGTFLSYSATFKHKDDLNNPRTSILDSVDTHFLEHVVRIVDPADDGKPDFLYFSTDPLTTDLDPLPDSVWSSDGATAPVAVALNGAADGLASNAKPTVHVAVPNVPSGFVFIRLDDPGQNIYQLAGVTRSDGKVIPMGDDAWTTHRIIRLKGQSPFAQNRVYLFDDNSTGAYTLTYQPVAPIPPMTAVTSPHDGDTFGPNTPLTVTAMAGSLQAVVKELDFYDGSTLLGSSLAAPSALPYTPSIGTHTLFSVAIDANGTKGTSAPVAITVNPAVTPPPTVQIVGPADGTDVFAPATVTVSAAASSPGGTIARVDFYSNGAFLGSTVGAPFVLTLKDLPAGIDTITAVATDIQNQATTSAPVTLQIEPSVTPALVPMLTPNGTATFMLQFPDSSPATTMTMFGTYSGRSFSGRTPVTPGRPVPGRPAPP